MPPHSIDHRLMQAAINLGARHLGQCAPNPAVGALVVQFDKNNRHRVTGFGATQVGGRPHAETMALAMARESAKGASLYVSLEPCCHHGKTPPCVNKIIEAGVSRVVIAMIDPDPRVSGKGIEKLRRAGIKVELGMEKGFAFATNRGHILRSTLKRPMTTLKMAISANGRIAGEKSEPLQITGETSRNYVHGLRSQFDAIAVGKNTVLNDNPALTCRLPGMGETSPIRVLFDRSLKCPVDAKIFQNTFDKPVFLVHGMGTGKFADMGYPSWVKSIPIDVELSDKEQIKVALNQLAEHGITRLLLEGGAQIAHSFIAADVVDEVVLLKNPELILPKGGPAFMDPASIDHLFFDHALTNVFTDKLGGDERSIYMRLPQVGEV